MEGNMTGLQEESMVFPWYREWERVAAHTLDGGTGKLGRAFHLHGQAARAPGGGGGAGAGGRRKGLRAGRPRSDKGRPTGSTASCRFPLALSSR